MKVLWKLAFLSTACSLLLLASGCGGGDSTPPRTTSNNSSTTDTDDSDNDDSTTTDTTTDTTDSTSTTTTPPKKASSGSGPQPKAVGGDPASKWGSLKGRFVYDGEAPTPSPLSITKDQEVCSKGDLVDESLVVAEDGGLANVVLFLYLKRGDDAPEAHPDYASAADTKVELDNKLCRFEPHICLMQTSQTLLVKNSDPVGHNTKVDSQANPAMNPIIPAGSTHEQKFPEAERGPVPVSCSIHPWMTAHLVVRDNPYFAVSDANGNFEIKNLPTGTWTFQVWHEKGNIAEVTANGETGEWSRGRFDVTIEPGAEMDFGDIKVPAATFN